MRFMCNKIIRKRIEKIIKKLTDLGKFIITLLV